MNIYDKALIAQNAGNFRGLSRSFYEEIVHEAQEDDEYEVIEHPAVKLFLHQLSFLAGIQGLDQHRWEELKEICEQKASRSYA